MRKINNIIKTAFLYIVATLAASGCILEKYEFARMRNVIIQLDVTTDTEITKATPSEGENNIGSLRIYAFRGERLCGHYYQSGAYSGPILMDLELPDGVSEVDFYLIANEAEMEYQGGKVTLSENMTRSQLEAVKFTSLLHKETLPMYCLQRESLDASAYTIDPDMPQGHQDHIKLSQEVSFSLTRSLAKLSVYAAKAAGAAADITVVSADILTAGTREYSYLFPQTENVLDQVPTIGNDRSLITAGVALAKEVAGGTSAAQDPANYTPVALGLYLPEVSAGNSIDDTSYSWDTPSADTDAAVLRIGYTLGSGKEATLKDIYLPRIERNNHIKICILINASGQITISYDVADWDWDEDKMLDWFFDYPTHTYIWHMIPEIDADLYKKPGSAATMSETQPFVGYFQMTYPSSDKWIPTLEGLNASKCSIKVYDDETDAEVFSSESPNPLEVSESWYRIEVYPKSGYMDLGETVNLAITYTPSGFTESEYLLINGSYPDYFWPGSTSENYVTITMVN